MSTYGGRLTAVLLVAVLVVTAGCAGFGGSTDGPTETTAETTTDGGTDTQPDDSTAGGGATDTTPTASETDTAVPTDGATGEVTESSFTYRILNISTINDTAREVSVRLTNDQNDSAENVVVNTVMYAGNTTAEDQAVWTGTEELGTLSAGQSTEFAQTVALGLNDALKVRGADGWVTIVTTIETDNGTVTITQQRNVS